MNLIITAIWFAACKKCSSNDIFSKIELSGNNFISEEKVDLAAGLGNKIIFAEGYGTNNISKTADVFIVSRKTYLNHRHINY